MIATISPHQDLLSLRAEFPNPVNGLLPGQFVRARIKAGIRPNGILIPQRAVKLSSDAATVMILDSKNVVTIRPVKLGTMEQGQWAILDGLRPGDRWCLCASRWTEAFEAGVAPQVVLEATHARTLEWADLADLRAHAVGA